MRRRPTLSSIVPLTLLGVLAVGAPALARFGEELHVGAKAALGEAVLTEEELGEVLSRWVAVLREEARDAREHPDALTEERIELLVDREVVAFLDDQSILGEPRDVVVGLFREHLEEVRDRGRRLEEALVGLKEAVEYSTVAEEYHRDLLVELLALADRHAASVAEAAGRALAEAESEGVVWDETAFDLARPLEGSEAAEEAGGERRHEELDHLAAVVEARWGPGLDAWALPEDARRRLVERWGLLMEALAAMQEAAGT